MPSSLDSPQPSTEVDSPKLEPLAVIGIGCRLPGNINSPTEFWEALLRGVDGICEVPEDRWNHARFHDTNPEKSGRIRNAKGGFIDNVDKFDGDFFGYFPAAAQRIDPQQRLLLEVTHEAMEDAGLRRDQFGGTRTAVFVGSFMYDYFCMQSAAEQRDEISTHSAMGTAICSLANRISYDFNLTGPSVTLDTACSASLTALHLACQSVWRDEAEMAVAAGVNLMLRPETSIMLSKGGFLNPDQYCKAFDESANGYVRGEGVGVVLLKPLSRAMADGDAIYACVRASGVNQDGFLPEGYTVPNVFSQVALLESVYQQAGIDPATVDYVEAHGTGTPVGDPVETSALGSVLGFERSEQQQDLMIGSVKTNLGHLEGASGITGFIKGVLTAQHGIAPPNLHFKDPNPAIPWDHYRLQVPTKPTPLTQNDDRPLTVGVNSFGAGGANAHVVVQSPRRTTSDMGSRNGLHPKATLYSLRAANRESLRESAARHADFLDHTSHSLGDVAYSALTRRSNYSQMVAVVGDSARDISSRLRKFVDGQVDAETISARIAHTKTPKVAFVFSGQGGQWAKMGLRLMQREPVFRDAIHEMDNLFQQLSGWSLLEELARDEQESRLNDTVVVQPAVMAIQVALVKLYAHYGIHPEGVVGHSIGEVAAAYAAGALTLEQAVAVIYHRSQAQDKASGKGGMLAVGLSQEAALSLIEGIDGVSIGAVNGPEMLTLSGDTQPLELIAEMLEAQGVFNRPVKVQVAYHSHHMDLIQDIMLESLAHVQGVPANIPLYSTVSGNCEDGEHLCGAYWYQNVRKPVLFTDALSSMISDGFNTFVEIGPHPVLVRGAEAMIGKLGSDAMIAPAMTRKEPEATVFLQSLARLAARGAQPDTDVMFGPSSRYVRLPKNPWQHQRYWFEAPAAAETRRGQFDHPFLKRQTELVTEQGLAVWDSSLDVGTFPYLRDHQVDGEIVFPATGHIELAWAVANEQFRHESFFLENLRFETPLILAENSRHPLDVRLEIISKDGDYRICSRTIEDRPGEPTWSKHSAGRINTSHDRFESDTISLAELRGHYHDNNEVSVDEFYAKVSAAGLEYGPKFQCIQQLWQRKHEMLAQLELPDDLVHESLRKFVHPALLDACLHVVFADVHNQGDADRVYLPAHMDRVRIASRPSKVVWSHVRVTRYDDQHICLDATIYDEHGELVAEMLGITCKRLSGAGAQMTDSLYEGCYEYRWNPSAQDPELHGRNFDYTTAALIVSPDQDAAATDIIATVAQKLEGEGIQPKILAAAPDTSFDELLAETPLDRRALIVFAAGLSQGQAGWQGLTECPHVPTLLHLAQMLVASEAVPRICVVTGGAADILGDRKLDLGQAMMHGMSRVINNECANVPLSVIDLSSQAGADEVDSLVSELLHYRRDRDEMEIALRGQNRFVRQLLPVNRDMAEFAAQTGEDGFGGDYRAELREHGMLDHIKFRRLPPCELGDNEVEIAVQAAGLAFKDVMNAMGMLPENAVAGGLTEQRLGLEVSGRVLRVDAAVDHVQPGDEVIARVAEGFCGRVVTQADHVIRRPASLSPVQAAGVPLVYVTAWYSLHQLGRIDSSDTVLIHSAAGGVGSAAIQIAQRAGATIVATAGTREKREYLRELGIYHVFDSRSLDFSNDVMEATGGRGVDIVLNSLTGRFIAQSMKCLAPFGRFIELGKSDIYRNNKLAMERLGENISYHVVDIDRLTAQKPQLHRRILGEVVELLSSGELRPMEITEFPVSQLADAMKFMSRSAYRGKIVMNMQDDRVQALPPRTVTFRSDRSYVISGGASGFGLEVARWMAEHGARHLVLVSRSGCKTDQDHLTVNAMTELGADVTLAKVDITDNDAVAGLLRQIQEHAPPIAGVIHGAAVLDDASIPTMDMERFQRVFNPKAQGAWNLHDATVSADCDLDFFVMLSSISSVLGLFGQLNYASANYFQDSLASLRRQQGLPATSVNLGVLGEYAGMSNSDNDAQDIVGILESQGMYVMLLADVLGKLEAALLQQPVQRMTAQLDWPWFRLAYPHLARDARFIDLMSDAALERSVRPKGSSLRNALTELEPEERIERLQQELAGALARILDASAEKIDVESPIDNLGLDSLMLTEFQVSIVRLLDVNVPLIKLLKGPSIETLAKEVIEQLDQDSSGDDAADAMEQATEEFALGEEEGIELLGPWLIRGAGDTNADVRLICFHSMGVGASLFSRFLLSPPAGYDIVAVQTPGRENRSHEPVIESIEVLADEIVLSLQPFLDRPFVIWGHSFGGTVAWEVTRRLREQHDCQPAHFVITGTAGPHLMHRWQTREVLLKALVTDNSPEYLVSLSRFVDDAEFLKSILPLMRVDYPLLKGYRFEDSPPLTCPITAFAARRDDFVYMDEISEWARHTADRFDLIEVDGDHWFLDRNRELIIEKLQQIAEACIANQRDHVASSTT